MFTLAPPASGFDSEEPWEFATEMGIFPREDPHFQQEIHLQAYQSVHFESTIFSKKK